MACNRLELMPFALVLPFQLRFFGRDMCVGARGSNVIAEMLESTGLQRALLATY